MPMLQTASHSLGHELPSCSSRAHRKLELSFWATVECGELQCALSLELIQRLRQRATCHSRSLQTLGLYSERAASDSGVRACHKL